MSTPILATKLYTPSPRPKVVPRLRLIERLHEGLHHKLILVSAPAGFGKTTLVGQWLAACRLPAAWLSLDEGDNDPIRFLTYLVAALQTIVAGQAAEGILGTGVGTGVLRALQSPQPPPIEAILTALLNEITPVPDKPATGSGQDFILVLDDYHVIEAQAVDNALVFLLEHLPPQMHLVIATREDPPLPLARLRARSHLTELRAADLRFTLAEAAEFFNQGMGLTLSVEEIAALESRTEGWIAGLQLAALALSGTSSRPGEQDTVGFIKSFSGSHHFVLDYLVEEVLHQQSATVQTFLLHTAILDRLCGPLCDAVLLDASASGQEMLAYLERANLFIVPLDNERRWYRYHHLFADLLRQRLYQSAPPHSSPPPGETAAGSVVELHKRASIWYEENGLEIEAFHHAVAANDIARAERLIEGGPMPLQFRGGAVPILNWLASLPAAVLDARPVLWITYASALLMMGQVVGVAEKADAAEAALPDGEQDDKTRDLIGRIASLRATVAVTQHQVETIIIQAQRALDYLHPDNLPVRTSITWTLGYAYQLQGERAAAARAYREAISICRVIGHTVIHMMATLGLGRIQEAENQLYQAGETYRQALDLVGEPPPPPICDAYLGLARIHYQWNDLDAAQQYGQQSLPLARQIENTDRFVACELFLARLKLAQGDVAAAAALAARAGQSARQHNFVQQMPEVTAVQLLVMLHQGNLAAAARLAQTHDLLPLSQARVHLAQADPAAALALLEPWQRQVEAQGWADQRLKLMVLQALAYQMQSEQEMAGQLLHEALALAAPGGFIRLFVDEGRPLTQLLSAVAAQGIMPDYTAKLLAAFGAEAQKSAGQFAQPLVEPLSQRELEILQLVAQGLSNREISERLFLALSTVKGHNRNIYGKLQVQRRTEAVARARELGLL
jgi:LuxR family transcriptional regulator, maltose regulon positive regulatory protein